MPNDTTAQVEAERALERAEKDLVHIEQLLDSDAYQKYFVRRITELRDQLRTKIADDDTLSNDETRLLRKVVAAYNDILRLPQQDRQAHAVTISQARNAQNGPSRG